MSTHRPRRIDPRTAEQLLTGAPTGAYDNHPSLAALLAAAAAPGRPDELAREHAALTAFRNAQLAPAPRPRALSAIKSAALRVLTVKAAVALAATTTAGGVALAASTGKLPNPLAQRPPAATSGLSEAPPTATPSPAVDDNDGATAVPGSPQSLDGSPAPTPSLAGLCQAYTAITKDRSKADKFLTARPGPGRSATAKAKADKSTGSELLDRLLDNPAFRDLVGAAGGKDKVERFCTSATPTPSRSITPHGGKPTDRGDNQGNANNDDKNTANSGPSN